MRKRKVPQTKKFRDWFAVHAHFRKGGEHQDRKKGIKHTRRQARTDEKEV